MKHNQFYSSPSDADPDWDYKPIEQPANWPETLMILIVPAIIFVILCAVIVYYVTHPAPDSTWFIQHSQIPNK